MQSKTRLIHQGYQSDKETGAIMPPIYLTSTYRQEEPGVSLAGYDYTRAGNPNFTQLEELLASAENAKHATVFSSGLGAITALISTLEMGDHVVIVNSIYGGTYRLFTKIFQKFGVHSHFIKEEELENALKTDPKFVFFETPTNPLLEITDIKKITGLAKRYKVLSIVDNTFATPYFQNPILLGADIVIHSTTKYIGGHSDAIGGVMMTNLIEIKEKMDFARMALGVNPSPFDSWLIMRGAKTLAIRMEAHAKNAMALALFLKGHPKVKHVYYPGLEGHPSHQIAKQQMKGFGGIVSAEFNLSPVELNAMLKNLKLFVLGESLGGVESLVCVPAVMTHASIPEKERLKMGISSTLIRFSVGIEGVDDLIADLQNALT